MIDSREVTLYDKCHAYSAGLNVEIQKEAIPLGDILLRSEKDRDIVIIERKSIDDLLASIKDGRYKEQSYRLKNSKTYHHHNVIYIIEGIISNYSPALKKQIYGCITSLSFFKGFTVLRTSSVQETAELIMSMAQKIDKDMLIGGKVPDYLFSHYFRGGGAAAAEDGSSSADEKPAATAVATTEAVLPETNNYEPKATDYSNMVKKVKKDNITIENIHQIMLSQIPGMSGSTATQIMTQYKTIGGLIDALRENPKCLDGFLIGNGDKKRKMAKSVVENVKNYLTSSG